MKKTIYQLLATTFVLLASLFFLGITPINAQIGTLGIYGSVDSTYQSNVRYVLLEDYPNDNGTYYRLPVNGNSNFNFYYQADGNFLPGGAYKITYLGADGTTTYGTPDIIKYTVNAGHTSGAKVRDFNGSTDTRGMHGLVYARINGVNYPAPDLWVSAHGNYTGVDVAIRTNGNGFFDMYYKNGAPGVFLPVYYFTGGGYEVFDNWVVSGMFGTCTVNRGFTQVGAFWSPLNTTDPSQTSYYVTYAETNVGSFVIDLPGSCAP